jgi:7-cyano-7-deazaguanosine (preQ0) biosynthesis protein QueE
LAPTETLKISEIFSSLQGEGPSSGAPALFVRLALCNLRCSWCDTRYTWDFEQYAYEQEVRVESVQEIARRIAESREQRVIVTGGEPLLQQPALARLFTLLPPTLFVEIETNGTQMPAPALLERVDQWNVSPKLAHAGEAPGRRLRFDVLRSLGATGRAYLKLVVRDASDAAEVRELLEELRFPADRVYLMPEATTPSEHAERAPLVAALCHEQNVRFSPRLHVLLWGGERGR